MDLSTAINADGATIINTRYVVPGDYTPGEEFGRDYWAAVDAARAKWTQAWGGRESDGPDHVLIDVRATLVLPDRREDLPIARQKVGALPEPGEDVARKFAAMHPIPYTGLGR